jgi:hypothetical protein
MERERESQLERRVQGMEDVVELQKQRKMWRSAVLLGTSGVRPPIYTCSCWEPARGGQRRRKKRKFHRRSASGKTYTWPQDSGDEGLVNISLRLLPWQVTTHQLVMLFLCMLFSLTTTETMYTSPFISPPELVGNGISINPIHFEN